MSRYERINYDALEELSVLGGADDVKEGEGGDRGSLLSALTVVIASIIIDKITELTYVQFTNKYDCFLKEEK